MKNFVNILVLIIIVSIAYFIMNKKKKIDQLDWENPSVISINKERARAHFFDFDSKELALSNDGEPGSVLYYDINLSPFSSSVNQTDEYGYAWA